MNYTAHDCGQINRFVGVAPLPVAIDRGLRSLLAEELADVPPGIAADLECAVVDAVGIAFKAFRIGQKYGKALEQSTQDADSITHKHDELGELLLKHHAAVRRFEKEVCHKCVSIRDANFGLFRFRESLEGADPAQYIKLMTWAINQFMRWTITKEAALTTPPPRPRKKLIPDGWKGAANMTDEEYKQELEKCV